MLVSTTKYKISGISVGIRKNNFTEMPCFLKSVFLCTRNNS